MTRAAHRKTMRTFKNLLVAGVCMSLLGCASADTPPCGDKSNPIPIAAAFYRKHQPPEALRLEGGRLYYLIQEGEKEWEVTVGPRGWAGGGLTMLVRKRDMHVEIAPVQGQ
jgi:hypothetical protein